MDWLTKLWGSKEKLNPAQEHIAYDGGLSVFTSMGSNLTYVQYYEQLEPVNRAVNMLIDDCAEIRFKVGDKLDQTVPVVKGIKKVSLERLLNSEANPFQDIGDFKRSLYTDLFIEGNMFIYYDGAHMYRLPAKDVKIYPSTKTYIDKYEHANVDFEVNEVMHVKDNGIRTSFRGSSRLKSCMGSMKRLYTMFKFQDNFFENGAIPGLVLKSPNAISEKMKERMRLSWAAKYNPKTGGRKPMILDGGMEVDNLSNINFRELDFETSIGTTTNIIYKTLGIPPILMDGGNNANIRPNHRLYYLETIMPAVQKLIAALERFYGYKIIPLLAEIPALQPELSEQSRYYSGLVNGGIISPNEAREALNMEPKGEEFNEIRVPANIAGSASNPASGGRPEEGKDDKKNFDIN